MILSIYVSGASRPMSNADLQDILTTSRRNNLRDGITGILMWADPMFLQIHEGEACLVENLVARIRRDSRHRHVMALSEQTTDQRLFSDWSMGFKEPDPAHASNKAVFRISRKALAERISSQDGGLFFQIVLAFSLDFIPDLRA